MSDVQVSARERQVLDAIRLLTQRNGFPPTLEEIAAELGMSGKSWAAIYVRTLKSKGLVSWRPNRARTLRLL